MKKSEFCNLIVLSGFLNSSVQQINKRSPSQYKLSFYMKIPKGLNEKQTPIPVLVKCNKGISEIVYELLDGKFGAKITCLCELETGIMNGQQYYVFRLKDFCFGWHNLYDNPELGEVKRQKISNLVIDKIIEDIGDI